MKRLITSLLVILGLVFAQVGAAGATPRYWKVDIFDPAASTVSRTLNVEYKVFSTVDDNDFTVELFENAVSKGTQSITHANGDSGVFSINLPATGTYKYKVVVDNNVAGETKESAEKTVQVVDGPAPTVTTVFVNTAAAGGAGAGGAGGGVAAAPAAGQVAGAAVGEAGQVTDQAATTGSNDNKGVLGAETAADNKKSDNNRNWYIGGGIVVALGAGAAYYVLRMRRANEL
jgi:hypothetical protein